MMRNPGRIDDEDEFWLFPADSPNPTYYRSQCDRHCHFGVGNSIAARRLSRRSITRPGSGWASAASASVCCRGFGRRAGPRHAVHPDDQASDGAIEPGHRLANRLPYGPTTDQAIERMARLPPAWSLTIPEGAYNIDPTRAVHLDHPNVQHDLEHLDHLGHLRLSRGSDTAREPIGPFYVHVRDNIEANGAVRAMLGSFRTTCRTGLGEWSSRGDVPQSMSTHHLIASAALGLPPIHFRYTPTVWWSASLGAVVLEDASPHWPPRLPVCVQTVADVEPYALIEAAASHAGHQAMAYFGALAGYQFAHGPRRSADPPVLDRYMAQKPLRHCAGTCNRPAQYRATLITVRTRKCRHPHVCAPTRPTGSESCPSGSRDLAVGTRHAMLRLLSFMGPGTPRS